jgi:hypothetical protein
MAGVFKLQMDEEDYRILGPNNEEGPIVPYGDTATLLTPDHMYYCHVDDPTVPNPIVVMVASVQEMPTELEEVEFEEAGEAIDAVDDGDEDDEDDDYSDGGEEEGDGEGGLELPGQQHEEEDEDREDRGRRPVDRHGKPVLVANRS